MKAGFQKPKMRKMSERDFVDKIGHCSCRNPNCWIYILVDGVPRRFMKIVDPFKDERPSYKFHMDTITYSDRSMEGCKYDGAKPHTISSHSTCISRVTLWSNSEPSSFASEKIIYSRHTYTRSAVSPKWTTIVYGHTCARTGRCSKKSLGSTANIYRRPTIRMRLWLNLRVALCSL